MSEKIDFIPGKIAPATTKPGTGRGESATHSRSFADMLAEAEAVQDVVEVRREAAGPGAGIVPGLSAPGVLQGALHGAAELLLRPLPRLSVRALRERRKPLES